MTPFDQDEYEAAEHMAMALQDMFTVLEFATREAMDVYASAKIATRNWDEVRARRGRH